MEMLQIEVVRVLGNGRQIVRQQVIDVPAKKYQSDALYPPYPIVRRQRSAQSLHRLNEKSLCGNSGYVLHTTVASKRIQPMSPEYYDRQQHTLSRQYQKSDAQRGKEQRKRVHKPDYRHVDVYH